MARTLFRGGLVYDGTLPEPNVPVGSYTMAVRTGNLLFLSGHGAFNDGCPVHTGRLGETMTTEQVPVLPKLSCSTCSRQSEPNSATCPAWPAW